MLPAVGAAVITGIVLTIPGSVFLYSGWKHLQRYGELRETPVTATPADESEVVFVTGQARQTDDTVTGTVSGTEALLMAWDVTRWGSGRRSSAWYPEAEQIETDGFAIEADGHTVQVPEMRETADRDNLSGTVRSENLNRGITISDVRVDVPEFDTEQKITPSDETPDRLQDIEERFRLREQPDQGTVSALSISLSPPDGTRRFREFVVTDGQKLTVRGRLDDPERPGESPTMTSPEDEPLLVTAASPTDLRQYCRRRVVTRLYVVAFVIIGFSSLMGVLVAIWPRGWYPVRGCNPLRRRCGRGRRVAPGFGLFEHPLDGFSMKRAAHPWFLS